MNKDITYVALDAHKKQHRVAMVLPGEREAVEWTVNNEERKVRQMVKRIRKQAPGRIVAAYEAGPCGFALARQIESEGVKCMVIAPSPIPMKSGDRIKTDRRDAKKLVDLLKANLLTEVHPPTTELESVRDLSRCREAAKEDLKRAQHRVLKFLVRRGLIYGDGMKHWTGRHFTWLRSLRFENRYDERVYSEYLGEVQRQGERVAALDKEIEGVAEQEPYKEPVGWLRCFRGINTVTAVSLVVELYSIERFQSPRQLMSYLGLIPSECSSGEKVKKGPITKAGNRRVRRLLVEAAWHQRHHPVKSKALRKRRENQPDWVIKIADRAMKRLHQRYMHLVSNGKETKVAATAVAREMVGFLWSVLYGHAELVSKQSRM
jgi:transposase